MPDEAAPVPAVASDPPLSAVTQALIHDPLNVTVHMDKSVTRTQLLIIVMGAVQFIIIICMLTLGAYVLRNQSNLTSAIDARVRNATMGTCAFFGDAATSPPALNNERLSVELIETARTAYTELGCGNLPPPSAQLEKLAQQYQIPLIH